MVHGKPTNSLSSRQKYFQLNFHGRKNCKGSQYLKVVALLARHNTICPCVNFCIIGTHIKHVLFQVVITQPLYH